MLLTKLADKKILNSYYELFMNYKAASELERILSLQHLNE